MPKHPTILISHEKQGKAWRFTLTGSNQDVESDIAIAVFSSVKKHGVMVLNAKNPLSSFVERVPPKNKVRRKVITETVEQQEAATVSE